MKKRICGNWATLLLPINENESINFKLLDDEIEYLIGCKVDGIYSNGTAGEFFTQNNLEFKKISKILSRKCKNANIPFQIGASRQSYQEMKEKVELSTKFKPLAIQITLPDWFPLNNDEVVNFINEISNYSKGIPFVLYNPPHAKRVLNFKDYEYILPKTPNVKSIKVCDGDNNWYKNMKSVFEMTSVFVPGHHIARGISNGAAGTYSNIACLCPHKSQLWYNICQNDIEYGLQLEKQLNNYLTKYTRPLIQSGNHGSFTIDKFMATIGDYMEITSKMRFPYNSVKVDDIQDFQNGLKEIAPFFVEN